MGEHKSPPRMRQTTGLMHYPGMDIRLAVTSSEPAGRLSGVLDLVKNASPL
jgi:hypothetical protein